MHLLSRIRRKFKSGVSLCCKLSNGRAELSSCVRTALAMMSAVSLTSDPHAWLRPYFAALAQDHTFALRAPSTAVLCAL